jgi:hypothetical protein
MANRRPNWAFLLLNIVIGLQTRMPHLRARIRPAFDYAL